MKTAMINVPTIEEVQDRLKYATGCIDHLISELNVEAASLNVHQDGVHYTVRGTCDAPWIQSRASFTIHAEGWTLVGSISDKKRPSVKI